MRWDAHRRDLYFRQGSDGPSDEMAFASAPQTRSAPGTALPGGGAAVHPCLALVSSLKTGA